MIDNGLHAINESPGMRQPGVGLEGRFVDPARMNVKQTRLASRTVGTDRHAAGLLARRSNHVAQCRSDRRLLSCAGVEAGEDEQLHGASVQRPAQTGCSERNTLCSPKRLL